MYFVEPFLWEAETGYCSGVVCNIDVTVSLLGTYKLPHGRPTYHFTPLQ